MNSGVPIAEAGSEPVAGADNEISVDGFLGGRVEAVQPRAGHHRAGLEAVLIAAALPNDLAGLAIDLGAGAGVAGFCLAARAPAARIALVERERKLLACARAGLARPSNAAFADRVEIVPADIGAGALRLAPAEAVMMNPPFHQRQAASAPKGEARGRAHLLEEDGLDRWFRAAVAALKPGGTLIGVFRADGLAQILAAAAGRFGALDLLPIHPRGENAAHRLLLRGVKGSRAPLKILPGLVLHSAVGHAFRPEIDAILRQGAELAGVVAGWRRRGISGRAESEADDVGL